MNRAKLLVVGPCEAGKSHISNFLSEATDMSDHSYHPTQGCRILEFDVNNVNINGKYMNVEIELWDCSGDHKFEPCWPAIAKDVSGVVFVCDVNKQGHEENLEGLFTYFVEQQPIKPSQCILFAHNKSGNNQPNPSIPICLEKLDLVHTSLEDDGEALRDDFSRYLSKMYSAMKETNEQEELGILDIQS